jgi:centrosomal CEP192-like protein
MKRLFLAMFAALLSAAALVAPRVAESNAQILLTFGGCSPVTPSVVQSSAVGHWNATGATATLTLNNVATGDDIVVALGISAYGTSGAAVTVSDGSAYTPEAVNTFGGHYMTGVYRLRNASAGTHSIVLTADTSSGYGSAMAFEVAGDANVIADQALNNSAFSATPTTGSSAALAQANEIVFVVLAGYGGGANSFGGITNPPTVGYTSLFLDTATTYMPMAFDYKAVASTAAVSAAWGTISPSQLWGTTLVTFKGSCGSTSSGGGGSNAFSVTPTSLAFGTVNSGSSSSPQAVTVTNTGTVSVSVSSISFTGTNSTQFSQTNTCGSSIAVGANCAVNVTFSPTATGAMSAVLNVNGGAAGTQTVPLTGTGGGGTNSFSALPPSLNFGTVTSGSSSATQAVTVTDTGSASITVSAVTITGTNPSMFSQTNNCTTLASNATCTITVTFSPTTTGSLSATLNVAVTGLTTQTVALSGTGGSLGSGGSVKPMAGQWYMSSQGLIGWGVALGTYTKEIDGLWAGNANPNIVGYKILALWGSVEGATQGDFNTPGMAEIDAIRNYIAVNYGKYGKQFALEFWGEDFAAGSLARAVPAYILNNCAVYGTSSSTQCGWWALNASYGCCTAAWWRPAVMTAYSTFIKGIANHQWAGAGNTGGWTYDTDPNFRSVAVMGESSIALQQCPPSPCPDATDDNVNTQWDAMLLAATNAWPHTMVLSNDNYALDSSASNANIRAAYALSIVHGSGTTATLGYSGPDLFAGSGPSGYNFLTAGQAAYVALGTSKLPYIAETEECGGEGGHPCGGSTATPLLDQWNVATGCPVGTNETSGGNTLKSLCAPAMFWQPGAGISSEANVLSFIAAHPLSSALTLLTLPSETGIGGNMWVHGATGTANGNSGGNPANGVLALISEQSNPDTGSGLFQPNTWTAGSKTGFSPGSPSTTQLAYAATGTSPTTTAQWQGNEVGVYLQSVDFGTCVPVSGQPDCKMMITPQINWAAQAAFVDAAGVMYGSMNLQIPTASGSDVYADMDHIFVGPGGVRVTINASIFHLGATAALGCNYDTPTNTFILNVPLGLAAGAPYMTTTAGAFSGSTWSGLTTFSWSVSYAQFKAALTLFQSAAGICAGNPAFPSGASYLDPTQYVLSNSHLNAEFHWSTGNNATLGWSMSGWSLSMNPQ